MLADPGTGRHGHKNYGGHRGKVWRGEIELDLSQLHADMAWYCERYKKDLPPSDRLGHAVAEQKARSRAAGLWPLAGERSGGTVGVPAQKNR